MKFVTLRLSGNWFKVFSIITSINNYHKFFIYSKSIAGKTYIYKTITAGFEEILALLGLIILSVHLISKIL